jgi:PAS domain S-box-containing protein
MVALRTGKKVRDVIMGVFNPETGEHHWISIDAVPEFKPGEAKPFRSYTTFEDITERKRMEEELRRHTEHLEEVVVERTKKLAESEKKFRELAELLPQTVYEVDVKGDFLFLNQAGLDAFGYSQEELARGLNVSQLFVPGDMDRGLENLRRRLSGEKSGAVEYTLSRKDGTTFPILTYSSPIFRDNKVVGLRGVTVDITQRKRMEEEIHASKERLDYVVSSNPAVIFSAKPRADYSDYNIVYMSDRVVEMPGFEPRQFIGHPEFWDARVHHAGVLLRGGSAELQTDRKATIRPTVVRACDLPS